MKRRQLIHPYTAIINKAQQTQSKKNRTQALQWLAERFPEAFDNTKCIRPLKIGIMSDILLFSNEASAIGISRSKLREAVVLFTRRLDYLTCLKAQEMRVDLHGSSVSPVSIEEAESAAMKIKKHIEIKARKLNAKEHALVKKTTNHGSKIYDVRDCSTNHPANGINSPITHSTKRAEVIIKNKITRTYDPSVVARLKEKLGLGG